MWSEYMDAGSRLLTHRIQQRRADAAKTRIAKAPEIILQHRIGLCLMFAATESQFTPQGNQLGTCANTVAQTWGVYAARRKGRQARLSETA